MASEGGSIVLIAIDGSDQAEKAFTFYLKHIHRDGNRLVLIHAVEPPSVGTSAAVPMGMDFTNQYNRQIKEEKEKVKILEEKFAEKMRAANAPGKFKAVFSHKPGEIVLSTAKEEKATFIVMGTRGLGTVRRTLMGSVSDFVLHHSHCPVLICREE